MHDEPMLFIAVFVTWVSRGHYHVCHRTSVYECSSKSERVLQDAQRARLQFPTCVANDAIPRPSVQPMRAESASPRLAAALELRRVAALPAPKALARGARGDAATQLSLS